MPIRPLDLPELRSELHAWYEDGRADFYFGNISPSEGAPPNRTSISRGIASLADLYYVSPDMAELATEAAKSMPDHTLRREDVPTPHGFLYSPQPLWRSEIEVEVAPGVVRPFTENAVGIMWTTVNQTPDCPHGAVWLCWLTDRQEYLDQVSDDLRVREASRRALPRVYETGVPSVWPFRQVRHNGEEMSDTRVASWGAVVKATWTLMQQPIIAQGRAPYDRATTRRLVRKQVTPSDVRVLTLRRPKSASGHEETDRRYLHQWIVRGHWRRRPCDACAHRTCSHQREDGIPAGDGTPIWIAPHIKGPEGAPLLGGEKVYSWTR